MMAALILAVTSFSEDGVFFCMMFITSQSLEKKFHWFLTSLFKQFFLYNAENTLPSDCDANSEENSKDGDVVG